MLRAHGLACDRGDRRLFSAVDFSLAPGEWLQVEGANGAGKTSLLRMLAGLAPSADGHIEWDGQPVSDVRDEFHARLLYLGHAPAIKEDLSALENLQTAAAVAGRPLDEATALAALRRITELEPVPRDFYCGAFGWVDADTGEAELAVAIRTFWIRDGSVHFGTGAGITWGSDASAEWGETELKAERLVAVAGGSWPADAGSAWQAGAS